MKYYDAERIYKYIQINKEKIDRIDLGIMEDWMATNQRISANGQLLIEFPRAGKKLAIRSTHGSEWGTPVMRVVLKDGAVNVLNAYKSSGKEISPSKVKTIIAEYKSRGVKMLGWDGVLR
jgi:hypothetical protein